MSAAEIGAAMELLPALLSPVCHAAPRRELWPFGISGDLPILCCRADAAECLPLLRRFCLLKSCGAECELVYLSAEQGEYRQPLRRRVNEALAALGLEELAGSRGGVHFVPLSAAEIIESRAAVAIGSEGQGLSQALLDVCTRTVKIPMSVHCESLNAAAAAAALLWEMARGDALSRS